MNQHSLFISAYVEKVEDKISIFVSGLREGGRGWGEENFCTRSLKEERVFEVDVTLA